MAISRRDECNHLEDALAELTVVAQEARIALAHVRNARHLEESRPILTECIGSILDACTSARKRLSRLWERLEGEKT